MNFSDILFLSDFDLTLYANSERLVGVPRRNVEAVRQFMAEGGLFAVATGRAKPSFASHIGEIPTNAPCVMSNGALIYSYSEDKTYDSVPLSETEMDKVLELFAMYNKAAVFEAEVGLEVYLPDVVYAASENDYTRQHYEWVNMVAKTAPLSEIPRPWIKTVFSGEPEYIKGVRDTALSMGLNAVLSLPFLCEIQAEGVDKGVAARKLANMLGRKVLVCAGDAPNDLPLLSAADIAFVPQGSHPTALSMGYNIVCAAEDGAIADAIEALRGM